MRSPAASNQTIPDFTPMNTSQYTGYNERPFYANERPSYVEERPSSIRVRAPLQKEPSFSNEPKPPLRPPPGLSSIPSLLHVQSPATQPPPAAPLKGSTLYLESELPDHREILMNYNVEKCTRPNCKLATCSDFHSDTQRRRRVLMMPNGSFNYDATKYAKKTL